MALVPFDDRDGWIWMDGKIIPWREAQIHVLTHALHYGSSVFEGERAYNGRIFKSREHTERFHRSAEMLGFSIPYSIDEIEKAKYAVLEKMNLKDAYVRPVAWRGSETLSVSTKGSNDIRVAICVWEWPSYYGKEMMEKGLKLQWSEWARPAPNMAPVASKAAGLYMICTHAKNKAEAEGFNDALMLDYRGYLAEATSANLFLVMDGVVHTPKADCFLDGITRRTVMQLARDNGFKVEERHIKPEELKKAQEVFLTGTAAEISPVGQIADMNFTVGPVTKKLVAAYHDLVRAEPKRMAS